MFNNFDVRDGVLIKYLGWNTVVKIPEGITKIGKFAFYENKTLTEVIMPDSVLHIDDYAFLKCEKLKTVTFSKQLLTIGYEAFENCKSLTTIHLPDTLKRIGSSSFAGCVKLSKALCDSKVFEPGYSPFYSYGTHNCEGMFDKNGFLIFNNVLFQYNGKSEEITVPDGVTHISDGALSRCMIKKVIIPDSVKHIGNCAFQFCSKLQEIVIPDGVEFGDGVFEGCENLADENKMVIVEKTLYKYYGKEGVVEIPKGVEYLADGAFACREREKIEKVILPEGLKRIGDQAFIGCVSLKEINIPDSVETIGIAAFSDCTSLENIEVPESAVIFDKAFVNCKGLADKNGFIIVNECLFGYTGRESHVEIPEHINYIGGNAFYNTLIKTVTMPKGLKKLGSAFCSCTWLEEIDIPEGVETLEETFSGCENLKRVGLPDTLISIGPHTFNGCTSLEHITVPPNVRKIDTYAFSYCSNLSSVTVTNEDCTVDEEAFKYCDNLRNEDGMCIIQGVLSEYNGDIRCLCIPDTVRVLAKDMLESRNSWEIGTGRIQLQQLVIPGSVKTIPEYMFAHCNNLEEVTLCDGVEVIEKGAFKGCCSISNIKLPSTLKYLGERAFEDCPKLRSVTIPKSVEMISADVFTGCTELTGIFVEEGNPSYLDVDGVLYNADKTVLIHCPGDKGFKEYTVPDGVISIKDHAFSNCRELSRIVIPASVKAVGNEVFYRNNCPGKSLPDDIHIALGAGSEFVGEAVIDFPKNDGPLVYPEIPVRFPKERTIQIRLAMGFCTSPEKYSEEYAADYLNFINSYKKTILEKAKKFGLKAVEAYLSPDSEDEKPKKAAEKVEPDIYRPDLKIKKPSEIKKVEILEEAVLKGTLEDVKAVLETYKTFEITAPALALAARFRGVDFIKLLKDHRATFKYKSTPSLQKKYQMNYHTAGGTYSTEYYLSVIPTEPETEGSYSPMYGIRYPAEGIEALPVKDRIEAARFFFDNRMAGVSKDEMLFWALMYGELEFADALIEMGADLNKEAPSYYTDGYDRTKTTYITIMTELCNGIYWMTYVGQMTALKEEKVLPVFERLNKLAQATGKKLIINQGMFDSIKWSGRSLAFALENCDFSKVNKTKALESAVFKEDIIRLEKLADAGWISQSAKREKLIEFAQKQNKTQALAWLVDYKNRTVDIAAEQAKAEKKMMRELTEDPNSVSALKKLWSYKKNDDGTLTVTSYKGSETEVTVPSVIGKNRVAKVGEEAFSVLKGNNRTEREKIKTVVFSEGITELESSIFIGCKALENIVLPSSLKSVTAPLAIGSEKLSKVNLSSDVEIKGNRPLFARCDAMHDENGCVILSGRLIAHTENNGYSYILKKTDYIELTIPDGVEEICDYVFNNGERLTSVICPETLKIIGKDAFRGCRKLESVKIKSGTTEIKAGAFSGCWPLRDVYIPESVKKFGKEVFGYYDQNASWGKVNGIRVHTKKGAPIVKYLENYSGILIEYDYDE